jgi:hypothetical protein
MNEDGTFSASIEFLTALRFSGTSQYTGLLSFDRSIGFSARRNYPENGTYYPPKRKDGTDDVVAVCAVEYFISAAENKERIPLAIRIFPLSQYMERHAELDYEEEECPTEESVLKSRTTRRPLPVDFRGEAFFCHPTGNLIDLKGRIISLESVLDSAFAAHLSTINLMACWSRKGKCSAYSLTIWFSMWFLFLWGEVSATDRTNAEHYLLSSHVASLLGKELAKREPTDSSVANETNNVAESGPRHAG